MLPVAAFALAGGVLAGSVQFYKIRKGQTTNVDAGQSQEQPVASTPTPRQTNAWLTEIGALGKAVGAAVTSSFITVEDQVHHFIQTRLEPESVAPVQLTAVAEERQSDGEAQSVDQRIVLSTATLGTAVGAGLFYPPLLFVSAPLAFYQTLPVYKTAYKSLAQEGRLTLDSLVALGSTGMWLTGYYVAGAFSGLVHALGHKLVLQSRNRFQTTVTQAFGQQPRMVTVWINDATVEIPFEQVQAGDTVIVHAGQTVPVDGVIVEGIAAVDQHLLSGEAQPVEKGVGDTVFAATVVLSGQIKIKTEKTGEATIAAEIVDVLNQTTHYHLAVEERGVELANRIVLPTMLLSGAAWPLVGVRGAVAVLADSPGIDMNIIAPITLLNFLNLASRIGILVKDGRSLELLHTVDTVVFDKTGTLTLTQPHVCQIYTCGAVSEEQLLLYAAAAEYHQSHPIAHAILAAANERNLPLPSIVEARYEVGYGIQVRLDNVLIRVGSERFMTLQGIAIPEPIQATQSAAHLQGHSLVMVARDMQLIGALELEPTVRPEAQQTLAALRARGLELYIISGDQEEPTRKLAGDLGIEHYFANILPDRKAQLVEELQQAGKSVCFVGDGINDAIALKKANVSISLRGATTVATDTAQIILLDQSLQQLPALFDLARKLEGNLRTSFMLTVVPGFCIIGSVFLLHIGIMTSVVAYGISIAAGVTNAMLPLVQHEAAQGSENQ